MSINKYTVQKCLFIFMILSINAVYITMAGIYSVAWYFVQIPLLIVAFYNIMTIILIILSRLFKKNKKLKA